MSEEIVMAKEKDNISLGIKALGWYGIVFGSMYIMVSVVSIILSILDRSYKDIDKNLIIGLYGVPILAFSLGFKKLQKWGWIGYTLFLAFIVVWSIFTYKDIYGIVVGILCLIVLALLLLPSVRRHYFST
jgi:hypothetical protein